MESLSDITDELLRAREDGRVIERTKLSRAATPEIAYAIQKDVLGRDGSGIGAWKLGGTAEPALIALGLKEPFFAPVLDVNVFHNNTVVAVPRAHAPQAELELALRLARRLPSGRADYTLEEVRGAVGGVHAAIEVVGCRVEGGVAGLGPAVIADGGVNAAIVIGDALVETNASDLVTAACTLTVNGVEKGSGDATKLIWQDPFHALLWLANHGQRSRDIEPGEFVLTGTCTGIVPLEAGDRVVGHIGHASTVSFHLNC